MKRPRQPNFIGQQNVAVNQQVNNQAAPTNGGAEGRIRPNELLETNDGKRMDDGASSTTGGADQSLAPVG
jgi:hypothetical protein